MACINTELQSNAHQILKQEWPQNWKDFIPQIVESGKTNETLCGNNMQILKLLSEEVFEFSLKQLTSKKVDQLKESLTQEFQLIFQFCEFVMQNAKNVTTVQTTLQCFLRCVDAPHLPSAPSFFPTPKPQSPCLEHAPQ